jgi:UDP-N-acetylmuramyl-tripeptide synthetase
MKLSWLLKNITSVSASLANIRISTIHYRAQEVLPNGLFVAIRGLKADGHDFIEQAVEQGATAVIVERHDLPQKIGNAIVIPVTNSRMALSCLASRFYNHPSRKLVLIGITGTNGKTTTAYLIEYMLLEAGFKVGVIGTINYRFCGKIFPNPMTTPESLDLHRILSEMESSGVTHVVMEVSSHAIDQNRVAHCEFNVGVFTNLTQDHLDYHQNMDKYWACKKHFFTTLLPNISWHKHPVAVINHNDDKGKEIGGTLGLQEIATGLAARHSVHPKKVKMSLAGISGIIQTPHQSFAFQSHMVGRFNLENILNAVGTATALNLPSKTIQLALETFPGVPGRLEPIVNTYQRFVFVDYAHTPDALYNVLKTLKETAVSNDHPTGKLICVFGCGGDRDPYKRASMGTIAQRYSDLAIITSDNPRTEPPLQIIEHILNGIETSADRNGQTKNRAQEMKVQGIMVEPDRKRAILLAMQVSSRGDTIVIAGKGHEAYQIMGHRKILFDDRIEARNAMETLSSDFIFSSRKESFL